MINVLIFILALISGTIATAVWLPLNIIQHIFRFDIKSGLSKINNYFYQLNISVDRFCNVSLSTPFNITMTKGNNFYPFGDEDDTISYVIAVNKRRGTLSKTGRLLANILNKIDVNAKKRGTNHLDETISNKIELDLKAYKRIKKMHN